MSYPWTEPHQLLNKYHLNLLQSGGLLLGPSTHIQPVTSLQLRRCWLGPHCWAIGVVFWLITCHHQLSQHFNSHFFPDHYWLLWEELVCLFFEVCVQVSTRNVLFWKVTRCCIVISALDFLSARCKIQLNCCDVLWLWYVPLWMARAGTEQIRSAADLLEVNT